MKFILNTLLLVLLLGLIALPISSMGLINLVPQENKQVLPANTQRWQEADSPSFENGGGTVKGTSTGGGRELIIDSESVIYEVVPEEEPPILNEEIRVSDTAPEVEEIIFEEDLEE